MLGGLKHPSGSHRTQGRACSVQQTVALTDISSEASQALRTYFVSSVKPYAVALAFMTLE